MRGSKVASRYAQALLDLAIEKNVLDAVVGDMNYLLEVCESNREFELLLSSPVVNADKKISIFKAIFDQFEEVSEAFVALITKNRRESLLPDIAASFDALVKEHKGIVPVTVISATPLDAQVKADILRKVEAYTKGTLEVSEEIDESIIGGFIVKMGNSRIDASVTTQLAQLKQRLTR